MKRLIIMRGAPGSGKSTLAEIIANALGKGQEHGDGFPNPKIPLIIEADQFFTTGTGYHFIPHLVPAAHEWCKKTCREAMARGVETIIISNTNTESWQFDYYIQLAAENNYTIQYIILHTPGQKNVHGVPEEKVQKMADRLRESLYKEGM